MTTTMSPMISGVRLPDRGGPPGPPAGAWPQPAGDGGGGGAPQPGGGGGGACGGSGAGACGGGGGGGGGGDSGDDGRRRSGAIVGCVSPSAGATFDPQREQNDAVSGMTA
jgi:hypothetical protein